MGYGKNLEDAITNKGWSIAETARRSGVNANTLRTIIHRDTSVRYDHALRLSNTLGIDINEICKENPYETGDVLPELPSEVHGLLTEINKSGYVKNRMDKLLAIYQYDDFPIIDELLSKFYVMSDEGRRQIIDYINFLMEKNRDEARDKSLKTITK